MWCCFTGGPAEGRAYKDLDSAENVLTGGLQNGHCATEGTGKKGSSGTDAANSGEACALKQAGHQAPCQNTSQHTDVGPMTADMSSYVESSPSAYQTIDSSITDGQLGWDAHQQAQRLIAAQQAALQHRSVKGQSLAPSSAVASSSGQAAARPVTASEVTPEVLAIKLPQQNPSGRASSISEQQLATALEAARLGTRSQRRPSAEPLENLPTIGALVQPVTSPSNRVSRPMSCRLTMLPATDDGLVLMPQRANSVTVAQVAPPSPSPCSPTTLRPSPLGPPRPPDIPRSPEPSSYRAPRASGSQLPSVFTAPMSPHHSSPRHTSQRSSPRTLPASAGPSPASLQAVAAAMIAGSAQLGPLQPGSNVMAGFHSVGANTPRTQSRPQSSGVTDHSRGQPSYSQRSPHRNTANQLMGPGTHSALEGAAAADKTPRASLNGKDMFGRNSSLSTRNSLSRLNSGSTVTSYMLQRGLASPMSSCGGNGSLARLLGVDDVAQGDLETPEELALLPLDDFSALDTGEIEELLTSIHNGEKPCNLLAASPRMPAAMRRSHWALEDYALLSHLHHGYVSDVVEARCKRSGARVALKVYSLPEMPSLHRVQLLREIRLHLALDHPHVVRLWAAFMEQGVLSAEVGRGRYNHVVLVQEYAEHGDLLALMMAAGGRLSERRAVNDMLRPLLAALAYCHGRGIVHRDLKPGNVLYGRDWALKLADFGLSLDLNEERANTRAGTLEFMAPEVLKCPTKTDPSQNKFDLDTDTYSTAADAWGIGALFYSTIAGQPPFKGANHKEVAAKIMDQQPGTLLKFPERMSPAARDFVLRCMRPNPLDRPTVLEMLSHPLLAMYAVPSRPNSGAISQTLPPVLEPCPEQMPAPGEQTAMPPPAAEAAC